MNTQTTPNRWHVSNTGNHQGLVIDENTGETIAVTYKAENAPLVAKAPELLEKLKSLLETYEQVLTDHVYDEDNGDEISPEDKRYVSDIKSLIYEIESAL